MADVVFKVKGYEFPVPEANKVAIGAMRQAKRGKDSKVASTGNLFFASFCNAGNTVYYTGYTLFGTVYRFPTQGKVEAKKFLNEEGMKAYNTLVNMVVTLFFTAAAIFKAHWALSFFEINDPCHDDGAGAGGGGAPLPGPAPFLGAGGAGGAGGGALPPDHAPFAGAGGGGFILYPDPLAAPAAGVVGPFDGVLRDDSQDQINLLLLMGTLERMNGDKYTSDLLDQNKDVLAVEDIQIRLTTLKTLLARILFIHGWEGEPSVANVLDIIGPELAAAKVNPDLIAEKQQRISDAASAAAVLSIESAANRVILEEQRVAFEEASLADAARRVEEQAQAEAAAQLLELRAAITTRRGELEAVMAALGLQHGPLKQAQQNWKQLQQQYTGVYKLPVVRFKDYIDTRPAVKWEGVNLTVPAAIEDLPEGFGELKGLYDGAYQLAEEVSQLVEDAAMWKGVPKKTNAGETVEAFGNRVIAYLTGEDIVPDEPEPVVEVAPPPVMVDPAGKADIKEALEATIEVLTTQNNPALRQAAKNWNDLKVQCTGPHAIKPKRSERAKTYIDRLRLAKNSVNWPQVDLASPGKIAQPDIDDDELSDLYEQASKLAQNIEAAKRYQGVPKMEDDETPAAYGLRVLKYVQNLES